MAAADQETQQSHVNPHSGQPQRKPIDVLPGQASFLVSNLHPILLLSLLFFNFSSLVRDPISTLLGLAPTIALVQLLYCAICLPTTGQASPTPLKPGQKKKSTKPVQDVGARVVPASLSLLLTLFLSTPLLYITIILFGGPLTSNTEGTVLLALHFALLATPPLFYTHGLDTHTWLRIASLQLPFDEVYGMSVGACVGAWLGAVPIPLDWDREWQRWPVTILVGVYMGAAIGKIIGGYAVKGMRVKIT